MVRTGAGSVGCWFTQVGQLVILTARTMVSAVRPPYPYGDELVWQFLFVLKLSWFPQVVTTFALCLGAPGLQSAGILSLLGSLDRLGGFFVLFAVRWIGPLVTAVVVGGVAGTAITADLGARKIREELDALQVLGVDPIKNLVVPRFLALMVVTALLDISLGTHERRRRAVAGVGLLDPAVPGAVAELGAEELELGRQRQVRRQRAAHGHHQRAEEGGAGKVGDAEALADQVDAVAGGELGLDPIQRRNDRGARPRCRLLLGGAEARLGVEARVEREQRLRPRERLRYRQRCELAEQLGVAAELVEGDEARRRAEVLVEVVLERKCVAAPGRVLGKERALWMAPVERGDRRARVGDRFVPELQDREGDPGAAGEVEGDRDVDARQGRAAAVGDALVVERPADLLAEVRDLELPEQRRGCIRRGHLPSGSIGAMALLDDAEIETRLAERPGWSRAGEAIEKTFECGDFVGSVKFIDSLVEPAEAMGHHPDLEISWDKVKVSLSTHSEGGLTANDFELAAKIDSLG